METLESRPGGVYRDARIKVLYAPVEFAGTNPGTAPIMRSLAEIAEEVSLNALYAIQAITLVVAVITVVVLSTTNARMVFAAAGFAVVFLAVAASAGFYLIAIKNASEGARS